MDAHAMFPPTIPSFEYIITAITFIFNWSWTLWIWYINEMFALHWKSHLLHLYLCPSWLTRICSLRKPGILSHWSQPYVIPSCLYCVWRLKLWRLKLSCFVALTMHCLHTYLTPSCLISICSFKPSDEALSCTLNLHLYLTPSCLESLWWFNVGCH